MSQAADQVQQSVQQALGRFDQLAASEEPPARVFEQFLAILSQTTMARGAVVWMPGGDDQPPRAVSRAGQASALTVDPQGSPIAPAAQVIAQAIGQAKPAVVAPESPEFLDTPLGQQTQFFIPIEAAGRVFGAAQVILSGDLDPKVYRQFIAFYQHGARAVGNYLARRQTQVISEDAAQHASLLQLCHKLLTVERPDDLLHELATSSRALLECRRVAAIAFYKREPTVQFSDVIDVNRKSVLVRTMQMLADVVRTRQAPLSFTKGQNLSEEDQAIEPLLRQVYDLGHAEAICLTPIRQDQRIVGVIIAEYADAAAASRRANLQQLLSRQIGPILAQCIVTHRRPLRRTSQMLQHWRDHPLAKTVRALLLLAVITGLGWALVFLPVPLVVRGDARLEPARLSQVSAPLEGKVLRVLVQTGQSVRGGDVLAEMDDEDLRLKLHETDKAIEAERVALKAAREAQDKGDDQASAELLAAQLRIESYQIHRDAILRDIEKTRIRAMIDGVVLTENTQHLEGMTVRTGDLMLRVADLGRFNLVTELHEEDLALVERRLKSGHEVPITFLSHAWPDRPQQTKITSVQSLAPTSTLDEYQRQHVFRVTCPIDLQNISGQLALANPSGRARLETGESSILYRYGRNVWRFIQMTLLF